MLKIFLSQKNPDKTFSRWYDFLEVMTNIFPLQLILASIDTIKAEILGSFPPSPLVNAQTRFLEKNNAKLFFVLVHSRLSK